MLSLFFFFMSHLSSFAVDLNIQKKLPVLWNGQVHTGHQEKFQKSIQNPSFPKITVLVFISTHCPCSKSHEPKLKVLAQKYPQLSFYGVLTDQNEFQEAQAFFSLPEHELGFPVILDQDHELLNALNPLQTPHAFVLNKDHSLLYSGGVDNVKISNESAEPYLENALKEFLKGNFTLIQRKPLGCRIKRS